MSLIRTLFEHHQLLWHIARDDISRVDFDSPEWVLLYHEKAKLAGWCTQIIANNAIVEDQIPQLLKFPSLDETGPHARWLSEIRTDQPRLFAYVTALELMRLALLEAVKAQR